MAAGGDKAPAWRYEARRTFVPSHPGVSRAGFPDRPADAEGDAGWHYRRGRMPRYFFHTHIGDDVVLDPDGRELANPDAAFEATRILALQLLQGADTDPDLLRAVLYVTDDAQDVVLEYPLSEALTAGIEADTPEGTIH